MKIRHSAWIAGAAIGAMVGAAALSTPAFAAGEAGPLNLRDLGNFMVGIQTQPQDDGSVNITGQAYVGFALPADKKFDYPLVLVHGGGGQSSDWFTTPDGRDGWRDYFVAAGFDVYWIDRPGYGRSPTNPSCGNGMVGGPNNTGFIAQLATSDPSVWPGGEPTPTNEAVIKWAATSPAGPYCGDELAAQDIADLLEQIGPAILVTHSAGGASGWLAADLAPDNVAGIIAFEPAAANPLTSDPVRAGLTWEPALPDDFAPTTTNDCALQGDNPSQLTNYTFPVVVVSSEMGILPEPALNCSVQAFQQAGVDVTGVYLPDRGVNGGGHFSMAQLDDADSAAVFIDIATNIEQGNAVEGHTPQGQ